MSSTAGESGILPHPGKIKVEKWQYFEKSPGAGRRTAKKFLIFLKNCKQLVFDVLNMADFSEH